MGQTPPARSHSSHKFYSRVERREIILFFPSLKRRVNCCASIIMRSITLLHRVLCLHSQSIFLRVLFEVFAALFPEPFCYLSLTSWRFVPDKNIPRGWNMHGKKKNLQSFEGAVSKTFWRQPKIKIKLLFSILL